MPLLLLLLFDDRFNIYNCCTIIEPELGIEAIFLNFYFLIVQRMWNLILVSWTMKIIFFCDPKFAVVDEIWNKKRNLYFYCDSLELGYVG